MAFYDELVQHRLMHYNRINEQLSVGSCPRLPSHISHDFVNELRITAVINLQAMSDIEQNCREIIGNETVQNDQDQVDLDSMRKLRDVYEKANILFIWIPVADFSSTGRELMLAQATLILKTMLDKGHRVYVHCNAGRFLLFSLNCTLKKMSRYWPSIWPHMCVSLFCIENSIVGITLPIDICTFVWSFR
jgi:atypical dual specificity phosphatase